MSLVKDEVWPFDENTRRWTYIRTAYAKPREFGEQFSLHPHSIEDALRGGWIVETNVGIDLDQIFSGFRGPD
jgi:hypothetical protein